MPELGDAFQSTHPGSQTLTASKPTIALQCHGYVYRSPVAWHASKAWHDIPAPSHPDKDEQQHGSACAYPSDDVQDAKDAKTKVRDYIDRFTSWDPDTRVEQYSLLQFDWELATDKDKWLAVEERLGKALGLG